MIRLRSWTQVLLLLLIVIAGCGPGDTTTSTPAPEAEAVAENAAGGYCDAIVVIARAQKRTECRGTVCTLMSIEVINRGGQDVYDVHFSSTSFVGCPFSRIAWHDKPDKWTATPTDACAFEIGGVPNRQVQFRTETDPIRPGGSRVFGVAGAEPCGGLPTAVRFDCTDADGNLLYRGSASKITDP